MRKGQRLLQVIWGIALSMIILSLAVKLPHRILAILGLGIVAGRNLLDPIELSPGELGYDRGFLHTARRRCSFTYCTFTPC